MDEKVAGFRFNPIDFSDLQTTSTEFETRYIKPPRCQELDENLLCYESAERLAADVVLSPNCYYFVVVNGGFYFGDFIEALIAGNEFRVKKLTISTLSMNENNIDSLANLLTGGLVQELNLIVSDYFYSHERHNLIPYLYQELDQDDKFQLAVAGTHCKLCIFETECGKHVVLHGSANLRSSGNIEQFTIQESAALYRFNDEMQGRIVDKYKTINKPVRHKALWQAVQTERAE
jgi:hypothetical protein